MKAKPTFHVLVCVDLSAEAGRQKLGGIYRFLSQGYFWEMSLIRSQKEFEATFKDRINQQTFDGLLIAMPENEELRALHRTARTPTAFIDYFDPRLASSFRDCVFIHDDDSNIGNLAAQHLLSQGPFNNYCYAAANDTRPWNMKRAKQFSIALSKRHLTTSLLNNAESRSIDEIVAWLTAMTPPIAILAAYDDTARHILDACNKAHLRIPEDVSVLGIGNDDLICSHTAPQLTSIIPDFEEEGYLAARELHAMMLHKRKPTQREILCGCRGIAKRGSTACEKTAAALVQQAISFIRKNALSNIKVTDIVQELHVSRRLADLRFREITGTSILSFITEIRLNRVKELLSSTNLRINEIARQCGYDPANLKNLFARHCNCSMRAWRKSNLVNPETKPSGKTKGSHRKLPLSTSTRPSTS